MPPPGLFFFWSGALAAFSYPIAAWLARRIGLVNTMAFTHLPSNIALVLAAAAPSLELGLAGALFAAGFEAWPLVICGILKTVFDIALLCALRHIKPPEEQ